MTANPQLQHPAAIEDFEAFIARPENTGRLFELIDGEITEVSPGRTRNSEFPFIIAFAVRAFCRENRIPCRVSGSDGAYQIGSNVAAPDFAYKRTPTSRDYPDPNPPLWVVEVISPTDKPRDIARKRKVYLNASILLWELYEQSESIHVYAPGKPVRLLGIDDVLDGGDVLPGFTLAERDIYSADEAEEES